MRFWIVFIIWAAASLAFSQDSVNVVFRYSPSSQDVKRAFAPGTFNNWGPNNNGRIQPDAPSQMTFVDSLNLYIKPIWLETGDTHNYKFHEQYDASGSDWAWFTDPLNPLINTSDNNNSILKVEPLMVFQVAPQPGAIIPKGERFLSAGIFAATGDTILFDQSTVTIDDSLQFPLADFYLPDYSMLHFPLSDLESGMHTGCISVKTTQGRTLSKTTSFTLTGGEVFFQTPSRDSVFASQKTVRWQVNQELDELENVVLQTVDGPPYAFSPRENGAYSYTVSLNRGINQFFIRIHKLSGDTVLSDTLTLVLPEAQAPSVDISISADENRVILTGHASDVQDSTLHYAWTQQPLNAAALPGIDEYTGSALERDIPEQPGHYSFKLTVTDSDQNQNSRVHFFTVLPDGSVEIPIHKTVPSWVHDAQIYSLFLLGFTQEGSLQAAISRLQHIRDLGCTVVWVLPVMQVEGSLDQRYNIGYNIVDFYSIDPVYGSSKDFKDFVDAAHDLGLRVILDVTPNHSSRSHPIALDVREKGVYSPYYDFYQHEIIPHNDNGLGQSVSQDGIVYYNGFSDALLNWNWSDAEARAYMLEVYKHWLREYDIDGYRLDVYWGPHRRYGRNDFDIPLRQALRSVKSDILILGETHGTGPGSEIQYADFQGGMDMGYDWSLSGNLYNYPSVSTLHAALRNGGYRPGESSYFMRFLENHDELRVAHRYNSLEKTKPVSSTLSLSTGIPMIYQGQEVGMGYNMQGSKEYLARSDVAWESEGSFLQSHYQLYTHVRDQFPAFQRQYTDTNKDGVINHSDKDVQPRLDASSPHVYAFARPFENQNGLALVNFRGNPVSVATPLQLSYWAEFSKGFHPDSLYYLNRLDQNMSQLYTGSDLDTLKVDLAAYETAVYTISRQSDSVRIQNPITRVREYGKKLPTSFYCTAGYPNPFNSSVRFEYYLPMSGTIEINIFNVLGQKIRSLFKGQQGAGSYVLHWDGRSNQNEQVPSGIYLIQTLYEGQKRTQRICLIR
ncbi:MAG: alpha-amylase family glycosyl hydrolase [candidate division KSB1 bacterium]|nr:alpha-amylase family glycosyl hydrolase [candidate division KSB1 bacterium]